MDSIQHFLFTTQFLLWLPRVFIWLSFVLTVGIYLFAQWRPEKISSQRAGKILLWTLIGLIVFRVAYAGLLTWGQYYTWNQSPFTKIFLEIGLNKQALGPILGLMYGWFDDVRGYFRYYVLGRFWFSAGLTLAAPLVLWIIVRGFLRLRGIVLANHDLRIMTIMGLIVGWPTFLLFVPLAFISSLIIAAIRKIWRKEHYFQLAEGMMIAAGILLALTLREIL